MGGVHEESVLDRRSGVQGPATGSEWYVNSSSKTHYMEANEISDEADNSSSASCSPERTEPSTPITPFSPSPEQSFPEIDVHKVQLSHLAVALDLATLLVNERAARDSLEGLNLEFHHADHALYKECRGAFAASNTQRKGPFPDRPAVKPITTGRSKSVIANVTLWSRNRHLAIPGIEAIRHGLPGPSPLSKCWGVSDSPNNIQVNDNTRNRLLRMAPKAIPAYGQKTRDPQEVLAEVDLFWKQLCLWSQQERATSEYVPPRLVAREGNMEARPTVSITTSTTGSGSGKTQEASPHHWNFMHKPVYFKTYTPPEVSLWASYQSWKFHFREESKEAVTIKEAWKLVDPFFYHGPPALLDLTGAKLREAVTGYVEKVYQPYGTWLDDHYDSDEIIPRSSEDVPQYTAYDPWAGYGPPQQSIALDPQDEDTVMGNNDSFHDNCEVLAAPEEARAVSATTESEVPSAETVEGDEASSEEEQSERHTSEESSANILGEDNLPEMEPTPSSCSNSLEDEFRQEDLVESITLNKIRYTPPRESSVETDVERVAQIPRNHSEAVGEGKNEERSKPALASLSPSLATAFALTESLQNEASAEESHRHLKTLKEIHLSRPSTYVHNYDDEDKTDYTETWHNPHRAVVQNPVLKQYKDEDSVRASGDDFLEHGEPKLGGTAAPERFSSEIEFDMKEEKEEESHRTLDSPAQQESSSDEMKESGPTDDLQASTMDKEGVQQEEVNGSVKLTSVPTQSDTENKPHPPAESDDVDWAGLLKETKASHEQAMQDWPRIRDEVRGERGLSKFQAPSTGDPVQQDPSRPLLDHDHGSNPTHKDTPSPTHTEEEQQRLLEMKAIETAKLQKLCESSDVAKNRFSGYRDREPKALGDSVDALFLSYANRDLAGSNLNDPCDMNHTGEKASMRESHKPEVTGSYEPHQITTVDKAVQTDQEDGSTNPVEQGDKLESAILHGYNTVQTEKCHRLQPILELVVDHDSAEESEPAWLDYMAERGADHTVEEDQPVTPRHPTTALPVEDVSEPEHDPAWLDYLSERAAAESFIRIKSSQEEEDNATFETWFSSTSTLPAHAPTPTHQHRQIRLATTAALSSYSDVSEIPASNLGPTFSEYFFGGLAIGIGKWLGNCL